MKYGKVLFTWCRGVFSTLSNIYDGFFLRKLLATFAKCSIEEFHRGLKDVLEQLTTNLIPLTVSRGRALTRFYTTGIPVMKD